MTIIQTVLRKCRKWTGSFRAVASFVTRRAPYSDGDSGSGDGGGDSDNSSSSVSDKESILSAEMDVAADQSSMELTGKKRERREIERQEMQKQLLELNVSVAILKRDAEILVGEDADAKHD